MGLLPHRSRRVKLLLILAGVIVGFVLAEIGVNVWLTRYASETQLSWFGTYDQITSSKKLMFARHHYLQFVGAPDYAKGANRHNSLGFRGEEIIIPKPERAYRVVLIGGSTTYTVGVHDYKESYPHLLQQYLRARGHEVVEVINVGLHAYSSWESLVSLQFRVLDLEPDLVIVYHGINDVHPRLVYPYDAYKGDNSGARMPYERPRESFWDHSAILRILRTRLGYRAPLAGLGFRRTFEYVPTNHADQFRRQKLDGTYPEGIFSKVSASQMLGANRPVYFERNLRNMIAICREHNVKILLMTFAFSPNFPKSPRVSSPEYVGAFQEHNQVVRRICKSHGVPCYDFASEMATDAKYWVDGRHVTQLGARTKAELVGSYLIKSGILQR